MNKILFMRRGGEEVAFWVKFVAAFAAIALILSGMTLVPPQARAVDADGDMSITNVATDSDSLTPGAPDSPIAIEPADPMQDSVQEDESPSTAESVAEALNLISPNPTRAGPGVNPVIEVDIDSIKAVGTEDEGVSVGDDVLVEGTWDASLADDSLGSVFWVTFPTSVLDGLKIREPLSGASLLRDGDDGSVIGFEVDTAKAGTSGDWKVKATAVAPTDSEFLNFRTSQNADLDVEVQLPGEGGIRDAAARKMSLRAAGDEISATVTSINRDPVTDPETQLVIGDKVRVEGEWDASHMNLVGGETFTVGFPDELRIPSGFTFKMLADGIRDIADGTEIGECIVNNGNTFTCEVNEELAGKEEAKGTWWIQAQAVEYTTLEKLTFDIPGGQVEVPLPGDNGGIGDGAGPLETKKSGQVLNDQKSIKWTVDIAGPLLAPLADPTETTVVLEDTLSEALQLCEPARDSQFRLLAGRPGSLKPAGTLSVVAAVPADPQSLTLTLETDEPVRTDYLYRLEYITCTTDGGLLKSVDKDDDTYTNSIAIGDRTFGAGIGKYTGWEPKELNKEGSLPGGRTDRFQKARWSITENGANLIDSDEIVITDTFGPQQEVCEGGLGIQVFQQDHLPTWDPETGKFTRPTTNITDQFTGTGNIAAAGATGFNATLKPVAGFEFDPNVYYTFRYHTCLTTGEIPTAGESFTNSAIFNGAEIKAEVRAPNVHEQKNGWLVTEVQDVAGESQPAGTTTDWRLRVDGQKFEDLDELVITDEFSDTLTVCEVPDKTLKERLNFKLEARDFVDGGGLATEDLTAVTEVGLDGRELSFTLDAEAFGDKHFDRDYSYFLSYTLCTSSGGLDAAGTQYSNSAKATGEAMTRTVSQSWAGGADGNGVSHGSFSLVKSAATGSVPFSPELEFTVKVEEFAPVRNAANKLVPADLTDPAVKPAVIYDIVVRGDGQAVSGHYTRGTHWQIRLTEVGFPKNSGFLFTPGQFVKDSNVDVSEDGTEAVVKIVPRANTKVQLQNTASLGKATITKVVEGEVADSVKNQTFTVNAFVKRPDNTGYSVQVPLRAGMPHTFDGLPIGTTIEFEEVQPTDTDVVTWGEPVFSKNPITVGEDASVTLTNKANASEGTFNLKKVLNGAESSNAQLPTSYKVKAAWGDNETAEIDVPANGDVREFGRNLPTGTKVTLTEVLPAVDNIDWGTPVFSGEGITVNSDGSAVVTIGRGSADLTVTNTAVRTGTFQLSKGLAGEAADSVPTDAVFTVEAEWKREGETSFSSKELVITADSVVELGELLPAGTEVRFSEIKFPEIDGIFWGTPVWGTNPAGEQWLSVHNGVATGIISDDPADGRLISLTNVAEYADRPVYITKKVDGGAAAEVNGDLVYKIQATFSNNEVRTYDVTAGEPKLIGHFPVGTEVTLSELQPIDTNEITWGTPTFSPEGGKLVVGTDLRADVTVTNHAEQTVGTFSVTKKLDGPEKHNPAAPQSFDVIATWMEDAEEKSHTMTIPVGGTVDFAESYGEQLPAGTKVTLTEVLPENGQGLAWSTATFIPGNEVIIGLDPVKVKLKNYVDKNNGTFQVLKAVTGEASEGVSTDVEFTVKAEWKQPGSTAVNYESTELSLKNDGIAVPLGLDLPVGTEVRFTEINLPEIEGIEWGTPAWDTNAPEGSWLSTDANGVATGIVSDDPVEGRIIKLTNDAKWKAGELEITKKIIEDNKLFDVDKSSIDEGSEFEVRITGVDPALPADINFPKIGQSIKLNKDNDWTWSSGKLLPKDTKVTFEEVNLRNGAGYDWAKPYYVIGTGDEGEVITGNEVVITGEDKTDTVEIHNRLIPTTEVDIDKIVTGPKGNEVENDASSTFQVTAKWQDADDQDRICILNVTPRGNAVPTSQCDATHIDGRVHFPTNTEITFAETGAYTDVPNVKWGEIIWGADQGAEVTNSKDDEASATVIFTKDKSSKTTLRLENKTSSNGLIIIPIPLPDLPEFPGSSTPTDPTDPVTPGEPVKPTAPGEPGKPVSQQKQDEHAQVTPGKRGLANTGANVLGVAGGALALILGGAWLALRGRRDKS